MAKTLYSSDPLCPRPDHALFEGKLIIIVDRYPPNHEGADRMRYHRRVYAPNCIDIPYINVRCKVNFVSWIYASVTTKRPVG